MKRIYKHLLITFILVFPAIGLAKYDIVCGDSTNQGAELKIDTLKNEIFQSYNVYGNETLEFPHS